MTQKRRRRATRIAYAIVLGLILFQVLVALVAAPLLESWVTREINKRSAGKLSLDAIDISLHPATSQIRCSQFLLRSTDSLYGEPRLLLDIPNAAVHIPQIRRFFKEGILHLPFVSISQPQLSLNRDSLPDAPDQTKLTPTALFAALKSRLQGPIRIITVEQFDLEDGIVRYADTKAFRKPFEARKVSLSMRDFRMDTLLLQQRLPFAVGEATLGMDAQHYRFLLPDSSYVLTLEKFGIDSREGRWTGEGLRLISRKTTGWRIDIPQLQLEGVEALMALQKSELQIGSIRIQDPTLVHVPGGKGGVKPDWEALWEQMSPWLRQLNIGGIALSGCRYKQQGAWLDDSAQVHIGNAGIFLSRVRIDSQALVKRTDVLFAEGAEVKADTMAFSLAQGNYGLSGTDFQFSTYSGSLQIGPFRLLPKPGSHAQARRMGRELIALDVPGLQLQGLNSALLWQSSRLELDSLVIPQPHIHLTNYPKVEKADIASFTETDLYTRIAPFLRSMEVGLLRVKDGTLLWDQALTPQANTLKVGDLSIDMIDFQLNDSADQQTERPFYARDIRVSVDIPDYRYVLPDSSYVIQAEGIGIRTADSSLQLENLALEPLKKDPSVTHFGLELPDITLKGIDAYKAYFFQEFQADSLLLRNPRLRIQPPAKRQTRTGAFLPLRLDTLAPASWISGWAKSLGLDHLAIQDMQLQLEPADSSVVGWGVGGIKVDLAGIRIDSQTAILPDRMLLADSAILRIPADSLEIADGQYQLSWDSLRLNVQRGDIQLAGAALLPGSQQDFLTSPDHLAFDIPQLNISGVEVYDWLVNRILRVPKLELVNPSLTVVSLPEVDSAAIDSIIQLDLYQLISKELEGFYLEDARITDLALRVNNQSRRGRVAFEGENGFLWIQGFRIDAATRAKGEQFDVDKFDLSMGMSGYSFQTPDSAYSIEVGELGLSTVDSSLEARQIRIIPLSRAQNTDQYVQGRIPKIKISGLDPISIYQERLLELGQLSISRPDIDIITNGSGQKTDSTKDMYAAVQKVFKTVSIRDLRVDSAKVNLTDGPSFNRLSLQLRAVELDSLPLFRPGRSFFADRWNVRLGEWSGQIGDSLYGVRLRGVHRMSGDSGWKVAHVRVSSLPNQTEFFTQNGYARDSLELHLFGTQFPSLDLSRLAKQQHIKLNQIKIDSFQVGIWKNRQWPRDPDRRPPKLLEALYRLPVSLDIDSLLANRGRLVYQEKGQWPGQTGYLHLGALEAKMYNIRTYAMPPELARNTSLAIRAAGNLMDTARFKVQFQYPILDSGAYSFSGDFTGMPLQKLNPILESAAAIRVSKGYLQKMRFQGQSNMRRSRGRMWMYYRDLQVAVIEPVDDVYRTGRKKRFMSAIANSVVVRTHNPKRRFIRVGRIQYPIEPDKSFMGHWIQSVLSGVKSSVGLTQKEDKDKSLGRKAARQQSKKGKK